MSQETRELALILRDRFKEKAKLAEFTRHAVMYLYKVFEDTLSEIKNDLIDMGGDGSQIRMYKAPDESYVVIKMGSALSTVYIYPKVALCPVQVEGQSGLCGRVIVFDGDFRNLEIEDPEQLSTIEEDSLFIFLDSILYHIVSPFGLHRTDVPRFVQLVLSKMVQKDDNHYSPVLEQILTNQPRYQTPPQPQQAPPGPPPQQPPR